ncbi:type II secretion system protein M [Citrobacter sp. CK184]|uniref:type II secretion system protein M n=1 Tax=unclassified Citrobacter TaxID=2644389 RepID=UPI00228A7A77|nr:MULTISPECIES: type II secretion system protein M [unclassified Citrobacter]MDM3029073.1 type II secretion system protein M [Citrobacter sp. CK185]MDM3047218.1 type II secretion system protein M [Citrobacter sp. CK184]HCT9898576.1 type II secretion system protein M [Citrobacter koseri]
MKERIAQLKARYQNYSDRERGLITLCAAAMCCAVIYYGGIIPLDHMIQNSQSTLMRQKETLRWMRDEIDKNHLQAKVLKTNNPRTVIEESAKEIHLALSDIRQDERSLSFVVEQVNIYELKNWLREVNITSGVQLQKMDLQPVDRQSDVKANITLSWNKNA